MSYFSAAFKALCDDPNEEAMVPRVTLRLQDGSNALKHSSDFTDSDWSSSAVTVIAATSYTPPVGDAYFLLSTTTAGTDSISQWEYETVAPGVTKEVIVSAVVKATSPTTSDTIRLYMFGTDSSDFAVDFDWVDDVPVVSDLHGNTGGVTDLGDGWYEIRMGARISDGAIAEVFIVHLYPNFGGSTAGPGIICSYIGFHREKRERTGDSHGWAVTTDSALEGRPGTPLVLTDLEHNLEFNPIPMIREREYGVFQEWGEVEVADPHGIEIFSDATATVS